MCRGREHGIMRAVQISRRLMSSHSIKRFTISLLLSLAVTTAISITTGRVIAVEPPAPTSADDPHQQQPSDAESSDSTPTDDSIAEVTVSGEQPGPSLWKVSKGDHVMYVLGTIIPLPKKMVWRSREVEHVIESAQLIIAQETVNPKIGFFRSMTLLPAALKARRNPDGKALQEILDPSLYARWSKLKATYIGRDKGIESWRPMFAGFELYTKALEKSGLQRSNVVWPTVQQLAKKHKVKIVEPELEIKVDDPRGLIKDFTETPRDADVACFKATLERLETDLEPMKQRAAAWAVGDLETLQRLMTRTQETTCMDAVTSVPRLQDEVKRIRAQAVTEWMNTVERSIARNTVTFAILPMTDLLSPTGRLAQLQSMGYTVEKP
jgi:uncharacterized protein YbaP (TraB family)